MDGVEKAIRTALDKGDAQDRAFREKVYKSAYAALERVLQSNGGVGEDTAASRRERLKNKIDAIESEFVPAVEIPLAGSAPAPAEPRKRALPEATFSPILAPPPPPPPPPPPAEPAPPPDWDNITLSEDELIPDPEPVAPSLDVPATEAAVRRPPPPKRRRSFAMLFMIAILFAAGGMAAWWTLQSGILQSPAERDTSVPNPPKQLEEESFRPVETGTSTPPRPQGEIDRQRDWTVLFEPNDPTRISAAPGTLADIVREGDETFLRVQAQAPGEPGRIVVTVGQGILESLAGSRVVFSIRAKSSGEQINEISVSCNFANLGNCGRRRFEIDSSPGDYLFEISLPDVTPGAGGSLTINPDFANRNRAADIFSIRVAPAG